MATRCSSAATALASQRSAKHLILTLGPERLYRHPVIDEYDFNAAQYQDMDGSMPEVRLEVVLSDLSAEAQRRFDGHLRRRSAVQNDFIDTTVDALEIADDDVEWCLPVVFRVKYVWKLTLQSSEKSGPDDHAQRPPRVNKPISHRPKLHIPTRLAQQKPQPPTCNHLTHQREGT
jgi:hypothetical protein